MKKPLALSAELQRQNAPSSSSWPSGENLIFGVLEVNPIIFPTDSDTHYVSNPLLEGSVQEEQKISRINPFALLFGNAPTQKERAQRAVKLAVGWVQRVPLKMLSQRVGIIATAFLIVVEK